MYITEPGADILNYHDQAKTFKPCLGSSFKTEPGTVGPGQTTNITQPGPAQIGTRSGGVFISQPTFKTLPGPIWLRFQHKTYSVVYGVHAVRTLIVVLSEVSY